MSAAGKRAARTRRLKKMITAKIERARHETWEEMFRICAAESPHGNTGAFNRWFEDAWRKAIQ